MTDINYQLLSGFIAAENLLRSLRVTLVGRNNFAWSKLDRAGEYVKSSQQTFADEYFADIVEEVA
jgi:hypothetical protein